MDENTSRRKFLAAAGAALFAGCSGGNDAGDGLDGRFRANGSTVTPRSTTASRGRTTTAGGSAEINFQTRQTETLEPIDDPGSPPTSSDPSETTEPPSADTPVPRKPLDAAERHLDTALDTYLAAPERNATSLVDVQADATGFDQSAIEAEIEKARASIQEAMAGTTTAGTRVAELRAFADFLSRLTAAQAALVDLYRALDGAVTYLFDENLTKSQTSVQRMLGRHETVVERIDELVAQAQPQDVALFARVTKREYARKVKQMRAEANSVTGLEEPFANLREAMDAFGTGVDNFAGSSNYNVAQSNFIEAQNGFEIAASDLSVVVVSGGMKGPVQRTKTATSAGVQGCGALVRAAKAGSNDDERSLEQEREAAIEALGRSSALRDSPSYRELTSF